jgi:hypothetical protein
MEYSINIPVQPGDRLLVYENFANGNTQPVLYEVTNLSISQNKKKQWTKKVRAMQVVNDKTIDYGITLNFEDIGKKAFIQEVTK